MKVLHLAAGDLDRGASRGALWLHKALRDQGVGSRFLTTDSGSYGGDVARVMPGFTGRMGVKLLKQLDRLPLRAYRFDRRGTLSPAWIGLPIQAMPGYREADIIHLHWINDGLLDLRTLQTCKKPIVWTARDLWLTTGLCHYPQGCPRQAQGCGQCPLLPHPRWPWPDPSQRGYRRKRRALAQAPITYVGISPWIASQLRASPIVAGHSVEMIWNCIDTEVFRPMPREEARRSLGLDPDADSYILAECRSPRSEPWKGFQHLLSILPALLQRGAKVLLFGKVPPELAELTSVAGVHSLGRIDDDRYLRRVYAAADVLICPTLEEAFGKTMAEAMACGTPVAAFACSAPADLVEPGLTGALATAGDSAALLEAACHLLKRTDCSSAHCAERARQRFSETVSARAYAELYERLCAGSVSGL